MALKLVDEFVDEVNRGDLDGFDPLTAAKHCAMKATQMQIDVIQTIFNGPEFKNHLTDALRDNLVLLEAGLNDIKKDIEDFDPGGL